MAAADRRVGICLDENCGRQIAPVLRALRAVPHPDIHDAREIDLGGTSDQVLMITLGQRGYAALITRDSSILRAALHRDAWRQSGLSLFVLDKKWGNLSLFEQARRLIWWWPELVRRSGDGEAWLVSAETPGHGIKPLFGAE